MSEFTKPLDKILNDLDNHKEEVESFAAKVDELYQAAEEIADIISNSEIDFSVDIHSALTKLRKALNELT